MHSVTLLARMYTRYATGAHVPTRGILVAGDLAIISSPPLVKIVSDVKVSTM